MAAKIIKRRPAVPENDMKGSLEYVPVSSIKVWDGNIKKHTDAEIKRLAAGIEKHGQWRPAVVWKQDKQIRVGNGMYLAITKILKWDHIWILWKDFLNKAEADLAGAFDNKSSEWSDYDNDTLRELFTRDDVVQLTGKSKKRLEDFSGFTEEDLGKLFIERGAKSIDDNPNQTVRIECKRDERDEIITTLSQWAEDSGFTDLIVH